MNDRVRAAITTVNILLRCCCIAFLVAIFTGGSWEVACSQSATPSDSLLIKKKTGVKVKRPGFDLPDSLYIAVDSVRGELDTIVYYTAKDSTVFDVVKKNVLLTGTATLDYQTRKMTAHRIIMDLPTNSLTATSNGYDSVFDATLGHQRRIIRDTARVASRGAPRLIDGTTPYEGEVLSYNLKTKQGAVQFASSTMQGGFYYGEKIKQVEPGTLFVQNGRYTTCDAPTPHFYFESPRMKLLSGNQVFAEPVYLFIADVPIFALPFAVFPQHESGRHSGLIPPNYTTQTSRGFGLTHLGYYVVFSDYFDAAIRSDLFTKGGYNLEFISQYMQRYLLSAPINLTLGYGKTRYNSIDPYQENFRMGFLLPNLRIDQVTSLSSNLSFESQNYRRNNALSINDVVNQSITSNASFSTSFEKIGFSLGIQYSRNQRLQDNTYTETSPSISIGRTAPFYIFGNPADGESTGILQTVALNYSTNLTRSVSKSLRTVARDSLHGGGIDSSFIHNERYGVLHSPSLSISPKVGYISFTPSLNFSQAWFFRQKIRSAHLLIENFGSITDTTTVDDNTYQSGFFLVNRYDIGVSASTTVYGVANIGALGIKAIRHVLLPSISFSYHPDLSSQEQRYYNDPRTGAPIAYGRFEDDLYSGLSLGGKSGTVGLSLGNDFEAKVEHQINVDSTTEEKVKLLNLSLGTSYDLIQTLWHQLGLSANTHIGSLFSLSANASYSFYPLNSVGGDSTQHTLIALRQGLLRATSASFHIGGGFSSSETTEGQNYDSLKRLFRLNSPDEERQMFLGGNYPGAFVAVPFRPKWNINYDVSYTLNYSGIIVTKSFSPTVSASISPTLNWSFSLSASYDLIQKQIVVPNLRIHRDLHCWELNLDYRPTGLIRGFNFEIRLKAPQLQDIKLTRQESTYGTF